MAFPRTIARIEECQKLLDVLKTIRNDPVAYRAQVNAAINGIRSIWDSLKSEGARLPGFKHWRKGEWRRLKATPLFKLFDKSRIEYFHMGDKTIRATAHIEALELSPDAPRPVLELTPEGLFSQDLDQRNHIPSPGIKVEQAIGSVPQAASNVRFVGGTIHISPGATVNFNNVDFSDAGVVSSSVQNDPLEDCLSALHYMEELVKAAQLKFGNVVR